MQPDRPQPSVPQIGMRGASEPEPAPTSWRPGPDLAEDEDVEQGDPDESAEPQDLPI